MAPQIIFGTASLGMPMSAFQDAETVQELLHTLQDLAITRLDSGARYPLTARAEPKSFLLSKNFLVDTKIFTDTATDGSGNLTKDAIDRSTVASLHRLRREAVNVLHIHRHDPATPLEEQVRNFIDQISQGRCKAWAASNVPPPILSEMLQLCDKNGWQKPVCYQGCYNLISRGMEKRLLPLLRAHGIKYNAFQPLAAGFLTGKLVNNEHAGTCFGDDHPFGLMVRKLFGDEDLTSAMKKFDAAVKAQGLTPAEVALRWLTHHSSLEDDDGVIIGASKLQQVIDTVGLIRKGPLPDALIPLVEELWSGVEEKRQEIL
ncbi:Aldo/keto reductase [Apiospora hydei]|uniref:Aldo/keto reductase n=1 Tax=Apiospora hydei TaxID=1337664 RepID=A0ABR1WQ76_9PEZI